MYTELMSLFRGESALTFLHKKGYILNLYKKPIKKTKKKQICAQISNCAPDKTKGVLLLVDRKLDLHVEGWGSDSHSQFCYALIHLQFFPNV